MDGEPACCDARLPSSGCIGGQVCLRSNSAGAAYKRRINANADAVLGCNRPVTCPPPLSHLHRLLDA